MTSDRSSDPFAATAVASVGTTPTTEAGRHAERPRDSQVALEVGKRLGARYDILGYLGEGGMGAVYRAFDGALGTDVALKVVRNELAGGSALRDEVRIAQQVTHENVCRTYDLEDIDGYHLIKMEYVAGETLAARIRDAGALPIDESVRIARAIVTGLQTAHVRGIVHRDLKPGNVMLAGRRVVLMDFGLARQITDEELERAGTPGYMAPEQLAGGRVDTRSDLYALGCLLYEMLTGERAFVAGTMTEVATRRASQPPPDLRAKRPSTPRWLVRATQLLMSNDPAARDGGLALLVAHRTRRRWIWAIALLVVGVVLGNAWWVYDRLGTERAASEWKAQITSLPFRIDAAVDRPAFSPDGKELAFIVDRAYDAEHSGELYKIPFPPTAATVPTRVPNQPDRIRSFRWRRDGTFAVAVGRDQQTIGVFDETHPFVAWGTGRDVEDCNGALVALVASPDEDGGDSLAYFTGPNQSKTLVEASPFETLDYPRCDREGKRIVYKRYSRDRFGIWVVGPQRKEEKLTADFDLTPTFSRDGQTIIFMREVGDGRREVFERSSEGKVAAVQRSYDKAILAAPEVSPSGEHLVFVVENPTRGIFLHDGDNEYPVTIAADDLENLSIIPGDSAPTTAFLAWRRFDETIVHIDLGGRVTPLARGEVPVISFDGQRVYYCDPDVPSELWVTTIGGSHAARHVAKLPGRMIAGIETRDGLQIAVDVDNRQRWVRLTNGAIVDAPRDGFEIPAPSGSWRAIQISRDVMFEGPQAVPPIKCLDLVTWIDESRVGCATPGRIPELTIFDLGGTPSVVVDMVDAPRREARITKRAMWAEIRDLFPGTLQQMTNFAQRPR